MNQTEEFTFENVTMYRMGSMFGTSRVDCRTLKVTTGVKYAQYSDAVRVEYVEKGKRSARAGVLCGAEKWIRVCLEKDAIDAPPAMIPNGNGSSISRYSSCDPRWTTDFEDAADAAGVPWLMAIGAGIREGEYLERCKAVRG